mmetsp:Transcript_21462/g.53555  ORF Transcript_21462/g.53555 Transcript_21462/m.53555 type:complete len:470 (+) Transcript_21462:22-1431(+)
MAEEWKARGNAAFKEGRYQAAVEHFTSAIGCDATNAVLFSNRSGAHASLGAYAEALADAEKAISLRPDWSKGYSRKGAALYGLGRYLDALHAYDRGLEVEPGNPQMEQASSDVRDKLQLAQTIFEAVEEGAVDKVQACLSKSVHPDGFVTAEGTTSLMAAARAGQADVVSLLLKAGAKPATRNAAGESARDLAKKGGHEAVVKLLPLEEGKGSSIFAAAKNFANKAVQKAAAAREDLQRGNLGADEYDTIVKQREERKRREAAEKLAEAQASKRRVIEQAMRRKAEDDDLALIKALHTQRAREEKEQAAQKARQEAEERARAAQEAARKAAEAEAARQQEADAEREAKATAFKEEGNDAFKVGRYADAVRFYTQAIELDPTNSVLYSNRSGALAASNLFEQALADADRCVSLRADWAKGHTRRASALHGMRRYLNAVQAYDDALRYEPGSEILLTGRRQSSFALAVEND